MALTAGIVDVQRGRGEEAIERFNSVEENLFGDPVRTLRLLRNRSEAQRIVGNFQLAVRDAHVLADLAARQQASHVSSLIRQLQGRAEAEQIRLRLVEQTDALTERTRSDSLTGVASRSWFDACLLERTAGIGSLAIVLIDVDNFKQINDLHSHVVGDEVLGKIGEILQTSSREEDLVARYGGEEFVVLPAEGDLIKGHELGERLRKTVEAAPWHEIDPSIAVTISVGVSVGPAKSSAEIFRAADDALYEAKKAGRNSVIARRLGRASTESGDRSSGANGSHTG